MIPRLLEFILGVYTFRIASEHREKTADALHINKINTFGNSIDSKGNLIFSTYILFSKELIKYLKNDVGEFEITYRSGLPVFAGKYCRRAGLYIGVTAFFLIVWISGEYVWSAEVSGNSNVSTETVLENLDEIGFSVGTRIHDTNFSMLRNRYLASYDDLCWISVNMTGTHASVEVKELNNYEQKTPDRAVNIIASEPGKINLVETFEGKPCVESGVYVGKGDLLISGIIDSTECIRFEAASGRILAEVTRYFSVSSDKSADVKAYTGKTQTDRELIFFKKRLKLSKNYRIHYNKYDTIENNRQLYLFNQYPLPVFVNTVEYSEYIPESEILETDLVGENLASAFSEKLADVLNGAQLINYTYEKIETEDSIQLICKVNCIADIAEEKTLDIALK